MSLNRIVVLFSLLVATPVHALTIEAPNRIENGALIPIKIFPTKPVTPGQQIDVLVDGQVAAKLKVLTGNVTSLEVRVKSLQKGSVVSARIVENSNEREKASQKLNIGYGVRTNTTLTRANSVKLKTSKGSAQVLVMSQNGFLGTLVLKGSGFHVQVTSGPAMTMNPYIKLAGSIEGELTSSVE